MCDLVCKVQTQLSSSDNNLHPSLAVANKAADGVVGSLLQSDKVLARIEHLGSSWAGPSSVASSAHGHPVVRTRAIVEQWNPTPLVVNQIKHLK